MIDELRQFVDEAGREQSDIDISFFYEPDALPLAPGLEAQAFARSVVDRVADLLQRRTAEGYVFRVDLRLRPDPSSTPAAVPVPAGDPAT